MAVGQVSSISGDNWQLIATNTPTSGTSSSFTSLSGYKEFRLIWKTVTFGGAANMLVRFNSDSTSYNYIGAASGYDSFRSEAWSSAATVDGNSTNIHWGFIDISDADKTFPKKIQGVWGDAANGYGDVTNGLYMGSSAITSISLQDSSGNTISAGTIYLYGIAS